MPFGVQVLQPVRVTWMATVVRRTWSVEGNLHGCVLRVIVAMDGNGTWIQCIPMLVSPSVDASKLICALEVQFLVRRGRVRLRSKDFYVHFSDTKKGVVLKLRFFQIRGNQPVALIKLNIRCDSFKGLQRMSDSRLQTFKWTCKQVSWNHDIMIHYGSFFSLASDFFGSDFNFWCHTRTSDSIKVRALNFFGETAASYYALFPVGQVEPRWEVTTAACDVAKKQVIWEADTRGRTPCQLTMQLGLQVFEDV